MLTCGRPLSGMGANQSVITFKVPFDFGELKKILGVFHGIYEKGLTDDVTDRRWPKKNW